MSNDILVIAEYKDSAIRRVTLEALSVAQQLLNGQSGSIHCYLSASEINETVQQTGQQFLQYGATDVHLATSRHVLDDVPQLQQLITQLQPTYIVSGHTAYGRELAPRLAASLGTAYIADVTAIQCSDRITFTRPIYAGKAFETRSFSGQAPYIVTIRPNNHPIVNGSATGSEIAEATHNIESNINILPIPDAPLRAIVKDVVRKVKGGIELTEADIIVAGGRGVRGSEGFQLLQQLADELGGAVGASRAACDAGYCDYSLQIGQTGKIVTPQLYIACGISGAIQHLAGMSQSRTIIAINKDPEAPIFSVADYGIVGDLFQIVPLLRDELLALKQN